MKNLCKFFVVAFCFTNLSLLTNKSSASCDTTGCDAVNFFADLSGSPDTSWTVSSIVRNGYCCGAGGTEKCIRIDVDAHPQAKFVKIEITAGAIPPGANYFKINCGPEVLLGEWTDISGLDSFCITFCKPGNNTNDYTVSILPPPSYPYCLSTYSNLCSSNDFINNFSFNTLAKNSSGCNGNLNNYIKDTSVTTTVELGGTYNLSMQAGSEYPQGFGVWIDYNQDGDFDDAEEFIYASPNAGTTNFSSSILIPDSALPGQTRLRVRCNYNATVLSGQSCGNFEYGETEDYTITLAQPPPCNEPPTAGTLSSNKLFVCYDPEQIILDLTAGTDGWGQYYTGQFSSDGVNWTDAGTINFPANVNNNGSTYYRVYATCGASSDTSSVVFVQYVPIDSIDLSPVNVSCYGGNDGSVASTVFGGTSPFSYLWINGAQTQNITLLYAGTYDVTVTDANGCVNSSGTSVSQPSELAITPGSTDASCGLADGMAYVSVNNGTPPYSYNWSNSATTDSVPNLAAGTYYVTVTDNNGCTKTGFANVSETGAPGQTTNKTDVTCFGLSDGTATVNAFGGNTPFTYLWDAAAGNQTTSTATGLAAGTYFVTVTNAVSCNTITSVTIVQPALLSLQVTADSVQCFGQNNGAAHAIASGGMNPLTFLWSNDSTSADNYSLTAGIYSVTITDNNGCTATGSVTVGESPVLIPNLSVLNATCFGLCDGKVVGGASGGIPPYSYSIPQLENSFSDTAYNICAGNYQVEIYDSKSCIATDSVTIIEPAALIADAGLDAIICSGTTTTIGGSPSASGGTPPYTYLWNPSTGLSDATIANPSATLFSTTYFSLLVTDSINCTGSDSLTITINTAPDITTSSTNVSCNGLNDGSATANVSGGTPSYTYLWSNSATTSSVTNLSAGSYSVTATDANGCTATDNVVITEPPATIVNAGTDQTLCSSEVGATLSGNISGSTTTGIWTTNGSGTFSPDATTLNATYNFSSADIAAGSVSLTLTSTNNGACSTVVDNLIITINELSSAANAGIDQTFCGLTSTTLAANTPAIGTSNWSIISGTGGSFADASNPNSSFNGTTGTMYILRWTISNAPCVPSTDDVIVTFDENPTVNAGSDATICEGNVYNVVGTIGGSASSATWTTGGTGSFDNANSLSAVYTPSAGDITAGMAILTLTTNANGSCPAASDTLFLGINLSPSASASSASVNCNGGADGSVDLTVSGGTPAYSYSWSNSATTEDITGVAAGNYFVTVTDANGCSATANATVTEPASFVVNIGSQAETCSGGADGYAIVSVTGGTAPYSYLWSNSATTDTITGLTAGTYGVTITDANGCTITNSANITTLSNLSVSVTGTDVSCSGGNNGTATVTPGGGITPYTYLWNDGMSQVTTTATGLLAGTYSVTVTDSYGCASSASATVNNPPGLNGGISGATTTSCQGMSDASATMNVTGGTSPYAYLWDNSEATATAIGLNGGSHSVTVTDFNNCTLIDNVVINEPSAVIASANSTNASCNGFADGSAAVTASGGTAPYTYLWSSSATTDSINGLSAGSYDVTVTDANTCTATANAVVSEPSSLTATATATDASCNGAADGSAAVTASGGTAPYSYLWSNASTTQNISGLAVGSYDVTVTDANGCTATANAVVTEPSALSATASSTNASCNGAADGSASVMASGGTTPYTYLWSNSATTDSINGLTAGSYDVTVTDANGCTANANAIVTEPTAVSASASPTNASCNGNADGSASVMASGGTAPYSYLWSNSATTDSINGLSAGIYDVTVTDANGCIATANAIVTEPSAITATATATAASCNGNADGSASVMASGGTAPYSYLWSNAATTDSINGLAAGSYDVTVTDANGCTATANAIVTEPTAVFASASSTNATCNGNSDGSASVMASGGTSPYSYLWSNSATTDSINGLAAGSYDVTVTDANGCTATANAIVTEPSAVAASASSTDATCNGNSDGSASVLASGGTAPYSYLWSNASTTQNISGLAVGSYDVTVTDANGCTAIANAVVTEPSALSATASSTNASCNGAADGSASVMASGGMAPYSYLWSNSATTDSINALSAGSYDVTVTDANGCTANANAVVTEPTAVSASTSSTDATCNGNADGSASVMASGGTAPYSYLWSNSATSDLINGLSAGSYGVTVTDANGCITTASATVTEPAVLTATTSSVAVNCGQSDGSASVTALGGTTPYQYNWSNGGTTATINNISAGAYSVTVTDANGCTKTATIAVNNPSGPTVTVSGTTNANCGGPDGGATTSVSGGTAPYTYSWSNGSTESVLDSVTPGTYTVTVTDASNCQGIAFATINNAGNNPPSVSGTVTMVGSGFIVNNGVVKAYKVSSTPGQFSLVAIAPITTGNYSFSSLLPIGNYIFLAAADSNAFPMAVGTYYGLTHKWDEATVVNITCDSAFTVDFQVINLNSQNGNSKIQGVVISVTTGKWQGFDMIMGDPVPGVDISLEQIPGGIVARDITDNDGIYSFDNVENGKVYQIYVDVPGLGMDSTYTIDLTSGDTTATNLNFFVGDTSIFIAPAVSVTEIKTENNTEIRIYPNPFNTFTNFEYVLNENSDVRIEVYNILGEQVFVSNNTSQVAGKYVERFEMEEFRTTGIYFVKFTIGENVYSHRIIRAN